MQPIHKNKIYDLIIHDLGRNGEGVGKIGHFVVYVPGALPGDRIQAKIVKLKKRYAFAKIDWILAPSPDRITPPCPIATKCGGCQIQSLDYARQCELKESDLKETLRRIGGIDITPEPILAMETPFEYRNKAQFAFGKQGDTLQLGLYASGSHRVIDTEVCHIQHPLINAVLAANRAYFKSHGGAVYNELEHDGLLRHLLIRASFDAQTAMVALVINDKQWPESGDWAEAMMAVPGVTSVYLNHNTKKGDTILGETMTHLLGDTHLTEKIGETQFQLSPSAFFQVNPPQTNVLYQTIDSIMNGQTDDCVWDIYCGTGSIGLYLAKKVGRVIGIESNLSAINDAKINAENNQIGHADFFHGKAEELMKDTFLDTLPTPTVVILDPPRKGCETTVLDQLIKRKVPRIIYVSCEASTFARDAKHLTAGGYQLDQIQPVDMFPHTTHLETVAAFKLAE